MLNSYQPTIVLIPLPAVRNQKRILKCLETDCCKHSKVQELQGAGACLERNTVGNLWIVQRSQVKRWKWKRDKQWRIECPEVMKMLCATWLMLSTLFCSLQLNTGSFPKPLTEEEERYYLERSARGDMEARNILIERNLRLVAHIMKKY